MAGKKLREPKVDKLFALLFRGATQSLEERRYRGMANLSGITPVGKVSDESEIEYYTDRVQRTTNKVEISELEAKSAIDDVGLKRAGTLVFFSMLVLAVCCMGLTEVYAGTNVDVARPANMAMTALLVFLANFALFMMMGRRFQKMDQEWGNSIDSFYGNAAKRQMEAVRDCMREFKRFLKWRRYMRLIFWLAVASLGLELLILATAEQAIGPLLAKSFPDVAKSYSWAPIEQLYAAGFVVAQVCWLAVYRWMYVYYTTFRDPTLHMAVLVNVMDRQMLQPILQR